MRTVRIMSTSVLRKDWESHPGELLTTVTKVLTSLDDIIP